MLKQQHTAIDHIPVDVLIIDYFLILDDYAVKVSKFCVEKPSGTNSNGTTTKTVESFKLISAIIHKFPFLIGY